MGTHIVPENMLLLCLLENVEKSRCKLVTFDPGMALYSNAFKSTSK